jgi:hypothetical protein
MWGLVTQKKEFGGLGIPDLDEESMPPCFVGEEI